MTSTEPRDFVVSAVDRALSKQRQEATIEVEAILDAALRCAERTAPAPPRVADIIAEAKTSNQAFYRYFSGKDDLMNAVLERGLNRVASYLEHQMSKETDPCDQIVAWIRGVMTQVTDRTAARQSAAVTLHVGQPATGRRPGTNALADLLTDPVRRSGSTSPQLDTSVIQEAVMGTMNRHFHQLTAPDETEIDHLTSFCLRGLTM
jgi:AcrR family transcriptional regulator